MNGPKPVKRMGWLKQCNARGIKASSRLGFTWGLVEPLAKAVLRSLSFFQKSPKLVVGANKKKQKRSKKTGGVWILACQCAFD
jgi:hypothetical protein